MRNPLNSPTNTYKIHAYLAVMWVVSIVPAWYLLRNSLFFIIAVSIYANFVSHWGAWQAVRAELVAARAEEEAKVVAAMATAQSQEMLERIIAAVVPVVHDAVSGANDDAVSIHRSIVALLAGDNAAISRDGPGGDDGDGDG